MTVWIADVVNWGDLRDTIVVSLLAGAGLAVTLTGITLGRTFIAD